MKTVAFIPLRGGSKSIVNKNIKLFNGRPLCYWAIDGAVSSKYIDEVVISTDSREIINVINNYNHPKIKIFNRSENSSSDTASTEIAMIEFANATNFNNIVLIQATSPLLETKYLDEGIGKYFSGKFDSVISLVRQKRFIWKEESELVHPQNYDYLKRPLRQDDSGFLVENGSFYITSKKLLLENNCRISGSIGFVEMPEDTYYEIDEEHDWTIVENLSKRKRNIIDTRKIKALFCDCDGVLTDGGMYYGENGVEFKKFNATDGMGFKLLRDNGIISGIISGENMDLIKNRGLKLGVDEMHLGIQNKMEIIDKMKMKYNIEYEEIAYIGDDINDLEVLKKVGFGCAVNNAVSVCKNNAKFITTRVGGSGAVREVIDLIINFTKTK